MKDKKVTQKRIPKSTRDYDIDPVTRRATFKKGNLLAFKHGGRSQRISKKVVDAAMKNDFSFELGLVKSQLINMATIGASLAERHKKEGNEDKALQVLMSCQKLTADAMPRIINLVEAANRAYLHDDAVMAARENIMQRLISKEISAIEAAFFFEKNQLGEVPFFLKELVQAEARSTDTEQEQEGTSKAELQQRLDEYFKEKKKTKKNLAARKKQIDEIKEIVREHIE